MENTLEKFTSPTNLVIGNFNRKIGRRALGVEETFGPFGFGDATEEEKG